jgi:CSLREA domain-containing protein
MQIKITNKEATMKKTVHFLCVLILILTLVGSFRAAPALALLAAFTVNTSTDAHDSNLGDGTCYNGVDGCSLRAAIEQAFSVSSLGDPLTIHFWSGIAGTLTLNLGPINWAASYVTLDGETNAMTISGSGLSAGQSIFTISGSHNTINHLTIRNAPQDGVQMGDFAGVGEGNDNTVTNSYLLGNGAAGVYVHGGSSGGGQGNMVLSNFIGLTDYLAAGCIAGEGNDWDGVYVDVNAQATKIWSNYIVCSGSNGVYIYGPSGAPDGTDLQNNVIGLNETRAMPNNGAGILDQQGQNTTITGNDISGNGAAGVWLLGSSGATLTNNYIGTNVIGQAATPNGNDGVAITDGATNNTVGGYTSATITDRNVISGNSGCGVRIRDGATNNTVDNNLIGLDRDNVAAIPNGLAGVCIFNANGNSIGTSMGGVHQYISGNTREGIYIENSSDNFIGQTNRIGVAADGTTARGNGMEGVMLSGASNTYVVPEILSYNGGAGVAVVGDTAINNLIYSIHTRSNGGLPIDLGNDGATLNGSHSTTGPNHWLGYPVITSASGNPVKIIGTTCANCVVLVYHAVGNPAANGSGGDFLSETTANGSGIWSAILPAGLTRNDVTLVAQHLLTGFTGDTSEMSSVNNYRIYLPLVRR